MKTNTKIIEKKTEKLFDITDVTDEVISFVEESGINDGLVNIQTMHTTATIFLNENEPLLLKDIKENLEKIAPSNAEYKHDDFDTRTVNMCNDECENGHSHCKAIYLPSNLTLNLVKGKLQLGQWQRVLFIELDRSRNRKFQIQIIGE